MRKEVLLVGNWKMYPKTKKEALLLLKKTLRKSPRGISCIIAPPSLYLGILRDKYKGRAISFAAQNIHHEDEGAFTGEISAAMLKDLGVSYAIVGHSERRSMGESDDDVRKKVRAALDSRLTPVLCVGEKERDKEGEYLGILKDQILSSLKSVLPTEIQKVIIAYEPVWAIGERSISAVEPKDLQTISLFIKKTLYDSFGQNGNKTRIIYGGSVDEGNAANLLKEGDMRGLLVGRESLNADHFTHIARLLLQ